MGLNSSLSSPTSEQVCLKTGGGGGGKLVWTMFNRSQLIDFTLKGDSSSGRTRAWRKLLVHF